LINFLSESVRQQFHELSPETQKEYIDLAHSYLTQGKVITINGIERWGPNDLEIAIRIDKKFNPPVIDKG
jgi:hypothetical protein